MTTSILAALHLTSWDQASAWVQNRRYPCEQCVEYEGYKGCRHYEHCKGRGRENAIVFFTRYAYRPDPRRGSVQG